MSSERTCAFAVLNRASSCLGEVFRALDETRGQLLICLHTAEREHRQPSRANLSSLGPSLRRHPELVAGIGVVMRPGVLSDAPRWLEWWKAEPTGEPSFLVVDFDPGHVGYHDYEATENARSRVPTSMPAGPRST